MVKKPESDIEKLTDLVVKFRDEREWKQFHNPKDMSLSLVLEATEVMEQFQWKNKEEMEEYIKTNKQEIADELADVLYWVFLFSHDMKINLIKAFREKMKRNKLKYPVAKAKGRHTKYTKL